MVRPLFDTGKIKAKPNLKKSNQIKIMLSDEEVRQLDFCCGHYKLTRAALMRIWIEDTYKKASK